MKFWQVDAFTDKLFCGNPAAVFILEKYLSSDLMQKIANEMNLSETAFVITKPHLEVRWFTPEFEVNLCGHATLSAAHILWQKGIIHEDKIKFKSKSGPLTVSRNEFGYTLYLPLQPSIEKKEYYEKIYDFLGVKPEYIGSNGEDCMVVVSNDSFVKSFKPNAEKIAQLLERGFLLSAKDQSGEFDYIYRGFFPKLGIFEDPVTGSANTCLAPYWAKQFDKKQLRALQASKRSGKLNINVLESHIAITGNAITVIEGEIQGFTS